MALTCPCYHAVACDPAAGNKSFCALEISSCMPRDKSREVTAGENRQLSSLIHKSETKSYMKSTNSDWCSSYGWDIGVHFHLDSQTDFSEVLSLEQISAQNMAKKQKAGLQFPLQATHASWNRRSNTLIQKIH